METCWACLGSGWDRNENNRRPQAQREEIARLTAERDAAIQRAKHAEGFIASEGYRTCDIPACNCPWWHGGNAGNRLREISEVLGDRTQGVTILNAVRALVEACEGGRDHG